MRMRPYIENRDYDCIEKWIDNEKIHAFLEKTAIEWTDSAYVHHEQCAI